MLGLIELSALDCLPCAPNDAFFKNSDDVGCCGTSCDHANTRSTSYGAVRATGGTSDSATRGKLTGGASDGATRNKSAGNSIGFFLKPSIMFQKLLKFAKISFLPLRVRFLRKVISTSWRTPRKSWPTINSKMYMSLTMNQY